MNESSIGTRRFRIIRQIFEGLRKSKYQLGIHGPNLRYSFVPFQSAYPQRQLGLINDELTKLVSLNKIDISVVKYIR